MTPEIVSIGLTIGSIAFTGGMAVGMFTAKFVSKTECKECRDKVWERIDAIQDGLAGQPIHFELRMVSPQQLKTKAVV